MSFNSRQQTLAPASGTFNGAAVGFATAGPMVPVLQAALRTIACRFDLTAATATIQLFAEWQVSDDNITYFNTAIQNNAASVVVATGTAPLVSVVLQAPSSVYGFSFCRPVVRNQVVVGGAADLFVMTPHYVRANM